MDDERYLELQAQIQGLQAVLSVALNLLPDHELLAERLRLLEETARRQNLMSGTIEVLKEFREKFEP